MFNAFCSCCRRGDRDTDRVVEETVAEFSNRLWHRCREEQCLALLWQQLVDTLQCMDEAKIHHLVGFIKDEDFNVLERDSALFDKVDQAARCGDKNIDAASKALFLAENRHAAENAINLEAKELAISAEAVGNLRRKFACWRQHKHAAAILLTRLWLGGEVVKRRQGKCSSLAGSGLRDAAKIAAF